MAKPFHILAICTGNVCRSPAVEALLRAALGDHPDVSMASAGTAALVGQAITGPMAALLVAAGADPAGFRAQAITRQLVTDADLVLALTRAHRAEVVAMVPRALRRAFTLREFARLAADVDPDLLPAGSPGERLAALVPLTAARRGLAPVAGAEDDVVDPYRGSAARYQSSLDQLRPAVEAIAAVALG